MSEQHSELAELADSNQHSVQTLADTIRYNHLPGCKCDRCAALDGLLEQFETLGLRFATAVGALRETEDILRVNARGPELIGQRHRLVALIEELSNPASIPGAAVRRGEGRVPVPSASPAPGSNQESSHS